MMSSGHEIQPRTWMQSQSDRALCHVVFATTVQQDVHDAYLTWCVVLGMRENDCPAILDVLRRTSRSDCSKPRAYDMLQLFEFSHTTVQTHLVNGKGSNLSLDLDVGELCGSEICIRWSLFTPSSASARCDECREDAVYIFLLPKHEKPGTHLIRDFQLKAFSNC